MEVMLARLVGLPSIGESTRIDVDYTSDLLGGLLFLWRLSISTGGVYVFLDLLLCLFFCPCRDSYVDPLGVLQVLLLLGGCLVS